MKREISQITPHLFVGRYQDSLDLEELTRLGITHILNVMESVKYSADTSVERLHLPVSDFGDTQLVDLIDKVSAFIDSALAKGGKVLLHCGRGQNRSPSVATAYLMRSQGMRLKDAFNLVRTKRPQFAPHESYLRQLQEMEMQIYGEISLTEDSEPLSIQEMARKIAREIEDKK